MLLLGDFGTGDSFRDSIAGHSICDRETKEGRKCFI